MIDGDDNVSEDPMRSQPESPSQDATEEEKKSVGGKLGVNGEPQKADANGGGDNCLEELGVAEDEEVGNEPRDGARDGAQLPLGYDRNDMLGSTDLEGGAVATASGEGGSTGNSNDGANSDGDSDAAVTAAREGGENGNSDIDGGNGDGDDESTGREALAEALSPNPVTPGRPVKVHLDNPYTPTSPISAVSNSANPPHVFSPRSSFSSSSSSVRRGASSQRGTAFDYFLPPMNAALILLSPRFSRSSDARDLVRSTLLDRAGGGAQVTVDRAIPGEYILRKKLVDIHFGEVARYAMEAEPRFLLTKADVKEKRKRNAGLEAEVDEEIFENAFGEKWSNAVSSNKVCNALRSLAQFGCDPNRLKEAWREAEARAPKSHVVRLGADLLCGLLSVGQQSLYVLNGFYMAVRGQYVAQETIVHAFVIEWDPSDLGGVSWGTFRRKICGCSFGGGSGRGGASGKNTSSLGRPRRPHPCDEAAGSLRRSLWERRAELGVVTGEEGAVDEWDKWDEVLYVSSSPLEALADRCSWVLGGDPRDGLSSPADDAPYGRVLMGRGLPEQKLIQWFDNPVVTVPPPPPPSYSDGTVSHNHIYDEVRDTDADECTKRVLDIYDFELNALPKTRGVGCKCAIS